MLGMSTVSTPVSSLGYKNIVQKQPDGSFKRLGTPNEWDKKTSELEDNFLLTNVKLWLAHKISVLKEEDSLVDPISPLKPDCMDDFVRIVGFGDDLQVKTDKENNIIVRKHAKPFIKSDEFEEVKLSKRDCDVADLGLIGRIPGASVFASSYQEIKNKLHTIKTLLKLDE